MSDNVWEWTASLYDANRDSYGVRGSGWYFSRGFARLAYRFGFNSHASDVNIGFRVVSPVF